MQENNGEGILLQSYVNAMELATVVKRLMKDKNYGALRSKSALGREMVSIAAFYLEGKDCKVTSLEEALGVLVQAGLISEKREEEQSQALRARNEKREFFRALSAQRATRRACRPKKNKEK